MDRTPVASKTIRSVGYDADTGTLEVEFLNGGLYHYQNVHELDWKRLMRAESKGKFLNSFIKPIYKFECVYRPPKKEKHEEKAAETSEGQKDKSSSPRGI
jgi:hypothetical protein